MQMSDGDVVIRDFNEHQITPEYLSWLNNKEHMKFSNQRHHSHTYESALKYLKSFEYSDSYFLSIESKENHLLGTCTVYYDPHNHVANVGLLISPTSSNKGVATSVFRTLLTNLPTLLQLNKITAGTCEANIQMLKVIEKSGMTYEYSCRNEFLLDGKYLDNLMYAKYC